MVFNQLTFSISSKSGKIWGAIFPFVSLILRSNRWFYNLFLKRCSPANTSVTSHNSQQTWEVVFWNCSLWLGVKRQAHYLFLKRCSKACICGNKPSQTKNMRGYFCLAVLITWCRTAFSQPLIHGVPEVASSKNKPKLHKNLRSNFRKFLLISWSWPLLSQPLVTSISILRLNHCFWFSDFFVFVSTSNCWQDHT